MNFVQIMQQYIDKLHDGVIITTAMFYDLADNHGISKDSIIERLRKLEKRGFLRDTGELVGTGRYKHCAFVKVEKRGEFFMADIKLMGGLSDAFMRPKPSVRGHVYQPLGSWK